MNTRLERLEHDLRVEEEHLAASNLSGYSLRLAAHRIQYLRDQIWDRKHPAPWRKPACR